MDLARTSSFDWPVPFGGTIQLDYTRHATEETPNDALAISTPAMAQAPAGASVIKHVIILMKENHTYDNYFGNSGIGDGVTEGLTHDEQTVPLNRPPDLITADIAHAWDAALAAIDGGRMDGFDELRGAEVHRYARQKAPSLTVPSSVGSAGAMSGGARGLSLLLKMSLGSEDKAFPPDAPE